MSEHICHNCEKSFNSADALAMHNHSKHPEEYRKPFFTSQQKKKIRNWSIFIVMIGLTIWGFYYSSKRNEIANTQLQFEVPRGPIHWHPHLTIKIDEIEQVIPPGIGLSGVHLPMHTHEADGIIHMENNNPTKQTVILGYFFKAWGKTFNKECIFDYCTDKGTLKMYVNGKENFDLENYFMKDKDKILIEYGSTNEK